jgi:NADH-quinone oxidoreductase subunit C
MIAKHERPPMQPGLSADELAALLIERFSLVRDARDQWDLTLLVPSHRIAEVAAFLRDDERLQFAQLLDIAGIDYLSYPNHRGPRFAVIYNFKSVAYRHRVKLKIEVEEDALEVPSLHALFKIANWLEREVLDQYGLVFVGHPNPKRLLNHHEFVGHPLRKDYPCQKRQKLSVNDPLIDQLEGRLVARGYQILDRGQLNQAGPISFNDSAGAKPAGGK